MMRGVMEEQGQTQHYINELKSTIESYFVGIS